MIQGTPVRSFRHALTMIAAAVAIFSVSVQAADKPQRGLRKKAAAKIKSDQPLSLLQTWMAAENAQALHPFPLLTGGTPIVGRASMVINASGNVVYTKNFINTTCDADIGLPTKWQPSSAYLARDNALGAPAERIVALNSGTSGATQP